MRKQHISRLEELIGKLSDQVVLAQRSFMTTGTYSLTHSLTHLLTHSLAEEIQMEEMLKQEARAKEAAIKW